jgi:capsular polysaccharide biosynthesis protein
VSEQSLDLRRSIQVVRRQKILVLTVAILGLLAGAAFALHSKPTFTSTALVVLPGAPQSGQVTSGPGTSTFMATQVVIADSHPVLSGALPNIHPYMPLVQLSKNIQASSQTSNILAISAKAATAVQAEGIANAVARSYITYVTAPHSPVGTVSANILSPAANATGTKRAKEVATYTLLGVIIGALIGVIGALAISRGDRRLRGRDEIANSVGVPVLASFPVAHPTDPAGWTTLLEEYEPGAVSALRLRQALQQLGSASASLNNRGDGSGFSLAVLSLSSDPRAVAVGPQLAAFAASLRIPTALVIGPQQDASVTATLRVACAAPLSASSKRPIQLQVAAVDDTGYPRSLDAALTVVVGVVDGRHPQVADTMRATATVLGVTAGAVTAEQLALTAASAATDGREIVGILVADPDPSDRTSGRIPQLLRPGKRRIPTRLEGITTEIRR